MDQLVGLFDHPHDESALHMPDILQLPKIVHMEVIIGVHILRHDLKHKVKFSGNIITLDDFGQFIDRTDKFCPRLFIMLFQ